ncbi:hypothetical protein [Kitasatospora sp. NPDC088548]|uniref:hypothetical protein n=1 Tax=Kitasatospora sp. NPDC088548 TaxID=3364075 RepID=UPI003829635C
MTGSDGTHPESGPLEFDRSEFDRSGFERPGSGRSGGSSAADTEEEQELRYLLRQAAPHLPPPADLLDRVLERAARTRRRRRTAGLAAGLTTGLVAAALAAAPAIAPAPPAGVIRPAATPPAPTAAASPTVTASPAPTSAGPGGAFGYPVRPVGFPELGGLVVYMPIGWSTLLIPSADPRRSTGYLASQPLTVRPSCTAKQSACATAPADELGEDGALIAIGLIDDQTLAAKLSGTSEPAAEAGLDKDCFGLGGTLALLGHRTVTEADQVTVVELKACLNKPSERTLQSVQQILSSVRVTGNAPAAPGSRRG